MAAKGSDFFWNTHNGKIVNFGSDELVAFRQPSKAHGNLSNIRRKSPALYDLSGVFDGLQIDRISIRKLHLPNHSYVDVSSDRCTDECNPIALGQAYKQDTPVFISPLTALPKELCTSENEHEPTKRGPIQVCSSGLFLPSAV